jgi:hypothetical protein
MTEKDTDQDKNPPDTPKVPDEYAKRLKSHEEKLRRYDRG